MYVIRVLFLCLILPALAISDQPARIGILTDLTGLAAYWGVQTQLGAELAQQDLAQEGVEVELFTEDHALLAKNAISAAQKLLYVDKVDALYTEFTPAVIPVSPLAKNAKKLFLGICAANSFLERNPYSFKSYIDYTSGCRDVAEYWKKQGLKKVAVLEAETEYGELCSRGFQQVYPDSLILQYKYGEAVQTQALKLKNNQIEAVINPAFEGDIINMLEAFSRLNYQPFIATNFDALSLNILKKYPILEKEFLSFGFQSISSDFIEKVKKKDPDNSLVSIEGVALAYIHIRQIVEIIQTCGSHNADCQVDLLSKRHSDYGYIAGFERFAEDRQAVFKTGLKKYSDGQEIWIAND